MSTPSETILIAEDSATQAMRLQNILERHGFKVVAAKNGRLGLEALATCEPVIVVSDIQMPVMDGYQLCRAIKTDPGRRSIPVMLLTSLSSPEDVIYGLECGADSFVVKPYDEDLLMTQIRSVLANYSPDAPATESGGIAVMFADKRYTIEADRRQILNLLLSTYETAVKTNNDLLRTQDDLKSIQAQLIEVEKIQALSRLSAGVAHEVRNPLAIIEMGLTMMGKEDLSKKAATMLPLMHEAVESADAVVRGLMATAAERAHGMVKTSLCAPIERALADLSRELNSARITVEHHLPGDLPEPVIDPAQIEQVFENLFSNALDAMPDGGKLTVSATVKELDTEDVTFEEGGRSGIRFRKGERAIVIEVRDTGHGITSDIMPKIFDPFFTTKPTARGKGMGLGLTVSKKLVELHNGILKIKNLPERGVLATVIFKTE